MRNVFEENNLGTVNEDVFSDSDDDLNPLRCWDCNVNFTTKVYLYKHLFHHIKQPRVKLHRLILPPLKITLKSTRGNSFEIVNSPALAGAFKDHEEGKLEELGGNGEISAGEHQDESSEQGNLSFSVSGSVTGSETGRSEVSEPLLDGSETDLDDFDAATLEDINGIIESETGGGSEQKSNSNDMVTGPIITEVTDNDPGDSNSSSLGKSGNDNYETIPGAEPTPPPEPSPDSYPKIRIKTTGLLKDPVESRCTITEITDDNPNGDPIRDNANGGHLWSTPSLEDPLKLPESDDNILSLFNNNERAKDFGFTSSDSEYISLDRLDSRNNSSGGALQLYNPPTSSGQSSLDSLTGLPMQALAQQVSRLQPSGNGMHQQNVLINIQQFPQAPPQAPYQPPPMYHHSGQPMYQPYQYQPPNPMYYPPGPTYPPPQHMPQPPQLTPIGQPQHQPQMNPSGPIGQPPPMSQPQIMPPSSQAAPQNQVHMGQPNMNQQQQQQTQQQQGQYRQPVPPRPPVPRQPMPGQRMPMGPRQQMGQRGPPMATRQRAPLTRPRGGGPMTGVRGVRPRMPNGPSNTQFRPSPVKRTPEQIKQEQVQVKKKRFDVLTPDKDDDDCQVICMQPKNTDGLPQIESVQGGTSEPAENSIMHLSDSITLSVRNPPPKPASPKKSDAKAVANILATRGITVTPTAKPKEKESPLKTTSAQSPLNLNGAVSIIPSAKQQQAKKNLESELPTVDLTDDAVASTPTKQSTSPQKTNPNLGLPYRCYLCPAQYPNALGLSKHRQNYHKTSSGAMDMGIPLVNLKQAGILQKLGQLGIHNFIPLPTAQPDGTFAVPIINARNPGNINAMGATTMLVLGPVKTIPRPGAPNNSANVQKPTGPQQK